MSKIRHRNKYDSLEALDPSSLPPRPKSLLINNYGLEHNPLLLKSLRNCSNNGQFWNRFMIFNESYSIGIYAKNFILKAITDFVYPADLLPVHYSQKGTKAFFFSRNCLDAIIKLCEAGLTIPNPNKPGSPFKVTIIKDVLTVQQIPIIKVEPNIREVLRMRLEQNTLNLERFHEDKDLREFCPLAQPKLLLYVLHIAAELDVRRILLGHNDIKSLPPFNLLASSPITDIDLNNNKIENIDDLKSLSILKHLKSLSLESNPLCYQFDNELTYFLHVKTICKNLEILDNRTVFQNGFYKKQRTYLCNDDGIDFADQFLQQFFTFYDEDYRPNIGSYYSDFSMFSLTFKKRANDSGGPNHFKNINRNLLAPEVESNNQCFLYLGPKTILNTLLSLPPTRHIPQSFCVDLMHYSNSQAIIIVSGAFKEVPINSFLGQEFVYGFSRTFALSSKDGKEWLITNDQLHVFSPYVNNANFMATTPTENISNSFPVPQNSAHEHSLTETFESITGMTFEISRMFLQRNNFNLELSLKVFIDEHINDEIPDDAFKNLSINACEKPLESGGDDCLIINDDGILQPTESLTKNIPSDNVENKSQKDGSNCVNPAEAQYGHRNNSVHRVYSKEEKEARIQKRKETRKNKTTLKQQNQKNKISNGEERQQQGKLNI